MESEKGKTMSQNHYGADDIQVLEGLERAVSGRVCTSGTTGPKGLTI